MPARHRRSRDSNHPRRATGHSLRQNSRPLGGDAASGSASQLGSLAARLPWLVAATSGLLVVWAFLAPADATSVFLGEALPQNLAWLLLAVGTGAIVSHAAKGFTIKSWHWGAILFCLVWLILGAMKAGAENDARVAWNGFWQVLSLAVCFSVISYIRRLAEQGHVPGQIRVASTSVCGAVSLVFLAGCIATATHGLHQVLVSFPQDRARYERDPEQVLGELGLAAPVGSPSRQQFESRLYSPEPFATFALTNSLAVPLTGAMILLAGAAVGLPQRHATNSGVRTIWPWGLIVLVALIVASCWLLTRSRAAFLAAPAGIVYWYIAWRTSGGGRGLSDQANGDLAGVVTAEAESARSSTRDRTAGEIGQAVKWIAAIGVALLLAGGGWLLGQDRLVLNEAPKSVAYRLEYWQATLHMLQEHGLWGVGLGNFQNYYPQYKLETASEIIADPHNWLLDLAISLSIPVAVVIIAWVGWCLATPWFRNNAQFEAAGEPTTELKTVSGDLGRGLLGGAVGGGALAILLLSLLAGAELDVLFVCWAIAWTLLLPLRRAIEAVGPSCRQAAVFAMLVCLLVSGSWQASGVAVPLLGLLACTGAAPRMRQRERFSGWRRYVPLAWAILGLVVFQWQSWQPVNGRWTSVQRLVQGEGGAGQRITGRIELAEAAAEADPLSAEPLRLLAQLRVEWTAESGRAGFDRRLEMASEAVERWLNSFPNSHLNWSQAGQHWLRLAASPAASPEQTQALIDRAAEAYRQAVDLHPSSVQLHAQVAVAEALTGDTPAMHASLDETLRLSRQTPHADKQLAAQLIWLPRGLELPPDAWKSAIDRSPALGDWCLAEPLVKHLAGAPRP